MTKITNNIIFDASTQTLNKQRSRMHEVSQQISSGKKYSSSSEAPLENSQALLVETQMKQIESFKKNTSYGNYILKAGADALNSVSNLMTQLKTIAIAASSDTLSAQERKNYAFEVKDIFQQMISNANTKVEGRYIFAGYKNGQIPFNSDGTFNGNAIANEDMSIEIQKGVTANINIDGYSLFKGGGGSGVDILSTVSQLITALDNNNRTAIQNLHATLNQGADQIVNAESDIGNRMKKMDMASESLDLLNTDLTERKADLTDADIVNAMNELREIETQLNASLKASTMAMSLSLMRYL